MKQEKFIFNHKTLSYDKFSQSARVKIIKIFSFFSSALFTAFILFVLAQQFFPSPKEKMLMRELEQLKTQYEAVNNQVDEMTSMLTDLHEKDAAVYRVIFGIDPIEDEVWTAGVGGSDRMANLTLYKNSGATLKNTIEKTDLLERQLSLQSKSLDSLLNLAKDRENYLASIPSIKPVQAGHRDKNIPLLSGFGHRMHPLHKIMKMHSGIDFGGPVGTPVRATGNGKVIKAENEGNGYGLQVIIDHGYGYKTVYAHLSKSDVKEGQIVTKGQKIGGIGNSGTSTAPHLHYEVHIKDKPVDPVKYCIDGLTPAEYQDLIKMASLPNKSFD